MFAFRWITQAEEAKIALSKEVIEAEAAEKRARDLKMTALVKHKFQGKLLDKQKAQQEQAVKDAFSHEYCKNQG